MMRCQHTDDKWTCGTCADQANHGGGAILRRQGPKAFEKQRGVSRPAIGRAFAKGLRAKAEKEYAWRYLGGE